MKQMEGLTLQCWDLGGHQVARQLWKKYCTMADGLIFMVDGSDSARLSESAQELHDLLHAVDLTGIPLAIFANKSELSHAMTLDAIQQGLNWQQVVHEPLAIFAVSVIKGTGYEEGFRWIAANVR